MKPTIRGRAFINLEITIRRRRRVPRTSSHGARRPDLSSPTVDIITATMREFPAGKMFAARSGARVHSFYREQVLNGASIFQRSHDRTRGRSHEGILHPRFPRFLRQIRCPCLQSRTAGGEVFLPPPPPENIFQPLHFKFSARKVLFLRRCPDTYLRRAVKYPMECLANRA